MDEKMIPIRIENEAAMQKWFLKNYRNLGYSKIVRKDIGIFPDFIMIKNGKEIKVELETLSSNFILHGHDINGVDEVVCIRKDIPLNVSTIEISELEFSPRIKRISATIDKKTGKLLDSLMKDRSYRNKSHVIEDAIEKLWEGKKNDQ